MSKRIIHTYAIKTIHAVTTKTTSNNTCDERDNVKILYLTFKGLTKLMFTRRHPLADHFQDWANDILFKVMLGNVEQKQDLAADVLGVSVPAIKAFLNTNVNSMPVVDEPLLG